MDVSTSRVDIKILGKHKRDLVVTQCGLLTPYGDKDLAQPWLRKKLVAWWYQAITLINVDFSSISTNEIHLRAISEDTPQPSIIEISLKMFHVKFHLNLPGGSVLMYIISYAISTRFCCGIVVSLLGFISIHLPTFTRVAPMEYEVILRRSPGAVSI